MIAPASSRQTLTPGTPVCDGGVLPGGEQHFARRTPRPRAWLPRGEASRRAGLSGCHAPGRRSTTRRTTRGCSLRAVDLSPGPEKAEAVSGRGCLHAKAERWREASQLERAFQPPGGTARAGETEVRCLLATGEAAGPQPCDRPAPKAIPPPSCNCKGEGFRRRKHKRGHRSSGRLLRRRAVARRSRPDNPMRTLRKTRAR